MSLGEKNSYDVRIEGSTVVVKLDESLEIDGETSRAINEAFGDAVQRESVDSVLTLLYVESALSKGVFDEVKQGASIAVEHGVTRWAIVVEEKIKGMAFNSNLDGLETDVFESEAAARDWLA